mmetsp:Transcript_33238/g.87047  ORF Transcript_33238/g.87047 Transcript_33238/m.87047 type:complete len:241 (+) Transcript_33238:597-1319(+)
MAVYCACCRDATKTIVGASRACDLIALCSGRDMAASRDLVWLMLKPWMSISKPRGRTFGWKLKRFELEMPSQLPRSLALATGADRATMRRFFFSAEAIDRIRDATTSSTGPSSPPIRWHSSIMKRLMFCTFFRCFHRRDNTSHCDGVPMMICPFARSLMSRVASPVSSTTGLPSDFPNRSLQSLYWIFARSSFGARYTQRAFGLREKARNKANSPQMVLPDPVGAPTKTLSSVVYRALKT